MAPTALSRKLASQGIKIPIRSDHKRNARGRAGEGDDAEEDDDDAEAEES